MPQAKANQEWKDAPTPQFPEGVKGPDENTRVWTKDKPPEGVDFKREEPWQPGTEADAEFESREQPRPDKSRKAR